MKHIIKKIHKNTLECVSTLSEKNNLKNLAEEDVDLLAESIELLNDVYEELYDKIFEDSESICKGTADQL